MQWLTLYDGTVINRYSDDYLNRRFFAYMNDGETWYSSPKTRRSCHFHNPLNGTAYGLCFHKDERWLNAVEQKMTEYYLNRDIQFFIMQRSLTIEQDNATGVCLKGMIQKEPTEPPKVVAHVHGLNYFDAKKLLLLDLVEIRATYLN